MNYSKPETTDIEPYVISADEFGSDFEREVITLVYYADNVLTDEDDEKADVENTIGRKIFETLKTYDEEDSIYIRNDRLKCDYEVLQDAGDYADIVRKKIND